jgi:N-acyl-phosphatidylethanolamine-hydrolysing phospholipase D
MLYPARVTFSSRDLSRARYACLPLALITVLAIAEPLSGRAGDDDGVPAAAPAQAHDLYLPHRDDDGFFNPWERFESSLWKVLQWKLSGNDYDKSREPTLPRVDNDGAYLDGEENSATITWVGHATFAVHDRHDVFLTDPHFSARALIPRRAVPPGIPVESIPADAFAVISHNHYDHLDAETVEDLPASVGWYVPLGLADWFRSKGREDVTELDWWQSAQRGRFTITCLPSQHWSRRIGQGENESLWCSWLIDSGDYRYYFAGDTGYFHGFAEFGRRFAPIDVAMLPIGAYEPRWFMGYQHLDPAQAYRAFRDLGARYMLPMHWGTFDLTDEPLDLPPRELSQVVARERGDATRVRIMKPGERWLVPEARR